jgi:hypothetical protein
MLQNLHHAGSMMDDRWRNVVSTPKPDIVVNLPKPIGACQPSKSFDFNIILGRANKRDW